MDLAAEFDQDMRNGARRCKEFGYNPTYWLRMVADHGGVGAAKLLLKGSRASDGFTRLWEEGRLDLSVEFYILVPKYSDLFTSDERAEARRRLELYEFDVDHHVAEWSRTATPPSAPAVAATADAPPMAQRLRWLLRFVRMATIPVSGRLLTTSLVPANCSAPTIPATSFTGRPRISLTRRSEARRLSPSPKRWPWAGGAVLKAIDEYNYCRFTKGWM